MGGGHGYFLQWLRAGEALQCMYLELLRSRYNVVCFVIHQLLFESDGLHLAQKNLCSDLFKSNALANVKSMQLF